MTARHVSVVRRLRRALDAQVAATAELRRTCDVAADRLDLSGQFARATRAADSDAAVLAVLANAILRLAADRMSELLLAAPESPHVRWTVAIEPSGTGAPVAIGRPARCRALVERRAVQHAGGERLDACAHTDPADESASCCVPLLVDNEHLGVIHLAGPPGDPIDEERLAQLEAMVGLSGDRIGTLRRRRNSTPDPVDPTPSLPTRHEIDRRIGELAAAGIPFAVAVCAIDHYDDVVAEIDNSQLARVHSLIGGVFRQTFRPGDVSSRLTDDRFAVVLTSCDADDAQRAIERVGERLIVELTGAELPPITLSTGIADSLSSDGAAGLFSAAECAVELASRRGGNRAVLAGEAA